MKRQITFLSRSDAINAYDRNFHYNGSEFITYKTL